MKNALTLFIAVLLMSFSQPLQAQNNHFVIGVEQLDYLPYYSGKDNFHGFSRELLDAFAKSKGYSFEYKAYPVKRLFHALLTQDIDFKFPDNAYWQSDLKKESGVAITYSSSIIDYVDGVMVLPAVKGKGIELLKKLGTVRGFTPWSYQEQIKSGAVKISENNSFSGLLQQTIMGRINGAYVNPVVASYQLKNVLNQPDALVFDPDLPYSKGSYQLSSGKHPQIVAELNAFLIEQKQFVDELKAKHNVIFQLAEQGN